MNPMMFKHMPGFVKKELEAISEVLHPYLKKHSKYLVFALPLLTFSVFNLFFYLITGNLYLDMIPTLAIYALMASIGLALYKESRYVKKEIENIGMEHMINRIKNSEHMNDYSKESYINTIKEQPKLGFQPFIDFLTEEHQRKQQMFGN
ncbi:DUF5392 family protein [Salinibacillus xinjiangensis]|uniref:DUF5392 family protein n=1 Tax=Salinibacillus xinjiangensis TaxID=1229268 RepID=A0A6G1X4K4_9BACI|nr:DUF5392 family protein [Salinibacillus xinjiangensis]MRG85877.1 hypothetical protein [Salinibacillus xinjiangensis]